MNRISNARQNVIVDVKMFYSKAVVKLNCENNRFRLILESDRERDDTAHSVCMCVCACVRACVHVCVCVRAYVCVYVCVV